MRCYYSRRLWRRRCPARCVQAATRPAAASLSSTRSAWSPGFNLSCRKDKLFLGDGSVQVLEIFASNSSVRINSSRIDFPPDGRRETAWGPGLPFVLSESNSIVLVSCSAYVTVHVGENNTLISSCAAVSPPTDPQSPVVRLGCCQANIGLPYSSFRIQVHSLNVSGSFPTSDFVYIVDQPVNDSIYSIPQALPASLEWVVSNNSTCPADYNVPASECRSVHSYCTNYEYYLDVDYYGYQCSCSDGYQGNPYIPHGCQDIDECTLSEAYPCYGMCINLYGTFQCLCPHGTYGDPFTKGGCNKKSITGLHISLVVSGGSILFLLALAAPFVTRKIKLQRIKRLKEKCFKQNHGLLLQQLISREVDIGQRMIITLQELEKATNNFDETRKIGGGGHGIVYKGILNLQVVAVKKSKIIVQREIDEFINEVVILSQINHRNVVKLLGCCLETEVPLLVYEFISNGTLYQHLHVHGPTSLLWDNRLRIALEVARALSYLHLAALKPIFHRDIKSSNILLDDSLTSKVSDFGASRYIPIDQSGVTTAIQGTLGYLDPSYYYTGRLTDKSDVYSFGVLIIELLTRKKPFIYRSNDGDGLVPHFGSLFIDGKLADIIDPQVMEEEDGDIQEVARLAVTCTKLKREDRPTMREVEMTLESIQVKMKYAPNTTTARNGEPIPTQGATQQASRQYSMEEEILLSSRYPR